MHVGKSTKQPSLWFEKLKVPHCCADYIEFVSGVANNKL